MKDIRCIARSQFTESAATQDSRELARAVLDLVTALQIIASVPTNSHEPLQGTCSMIAGNTLERWTGENWVGGAGGFDASRSRHTNRSEPVADKGK